MYFGHVSPLGMDSTSRFFWQCCFLLNLNRFKGAYFQLISVVRVLISGSIYALGIQV